MRWLFRTLWRTVIIVFSLAILGFAAVCYQVDRYGRLDAPQLSDAIVVLGAQVTASGQPGSDLTSRTYHGVDLYNAGWAPRIICTGGFEGDGLSAAAVARRFAIDIGTPPESVLVAEGGMNTTQDAQSTARLMNEHGWRSTILVSHPLHLYRAKWAFQRAGLTVTTSPTSTDTHEILLPLRLWYTFRESGALIVTALEEWGLVHGWSDGLQSFLYRSPLS